MKKETSMAKSHSGSSSDPAAPPDTQPFTSADTAPAPAPATSSRRRAVTDTPSATADEYVAICDSCRERLFMHETSHRVHGKCSVCGYDGTLLSQYPRADLRLAHL